MENKHIYVVLSSTASKFGRVIRLVTGDEYNHLSLALNSSLDDLCTFGRRKYTTPLNAGFVYEKLEYFTLNKHNTINVKIYKIPVTKRQYNKLIKILKEIKNDDEYMYNLFSALTYPFIGGFHLYKSYTCVEFVASVLDKSNIVHIEKAYKITPNEYGNLLSKYEYFSGNLLDVLNKSGDADEFFEHDRFRKVAKTNLVTVGKLSKRLGKKIMQGV